MAGLRWIKMYTCLLDEPKVTVLEELLDEPNALAYVTRLLLWTGLHNPSGDLSRWPDSVIAHHCKWYGTNEKGSSFFILQLQEAGFISLDKKVHNWELWNGALVSKIISDREKPRGNKSIEDASGEARPDKVPIGTLSARLELELEQEEELQTGGVGGEHPPIKSLDGDGYDREAILAGSLDGRSPAENLADKRLRTALLRCHEPAVGYEPNSTRWTPAREEVFVENFELDEPYEPSDLVRAAEGIHFSDYHMGRKPGQRTAWKDIKYALRDVERHRGAWRAAEHELGKDPFAGGRKQESPARSRARKQASWIREEQERVKRENASEAVSGRESGKSETADFEDGEPGNEE